MWSLQGLTSKTSTTMSTFDNSPTSLWKSVRSSPKECVKKSSKYCTTCRIGTNEQVSLEHRRKQPWSRNRCSEYPAWGDIRTVDPICALFVSSSGLPDVSEPTRLIVTAYSHPVAGVAVPMTFPVRGVLYQSAGFGETSLDNLLLPTSTPKAQSGLLPDVSDSRASLTRSGPPTLCTTSGAVVLASVVLVLPSLSWNVISLGSLGLPEHPQFNNSTAANSAP